MTVSEFESHRKRLLGFNELQKSYPLGAGAGCTIGNRSPEEVKIALLQHIRRLVNMTVVQDVSQSSSSEIMLAATFTSTRIMAESKLFVGISVATGNNGATCTLRINGEDMVITNSAYDLFKRLLTNF